VVSVEALFSYLVLALAVVEVVWLRLRRKRLGG
jgi:hypothetical protein